MANRTQVKYRPYLNWETRVYWNHAWRQVPGWHDTRAIAIQKAKEHLEILQSGKEADGEWHDVET